MALARHMSPLRDGYDHDTSVNSPDPLAETVEPSQIDEDNFNKRVSGRTQKKTTVTTPPSVKTVIDQNVSPWRIRVTLEAEPDEENTFSIGKREKQTKTVTKTIRVPLRDAGQSSPRRRIRQKSPGRGKKSSLTNLDAVVLGDDDEKDEWTVSPKSPSRRAGRKSTAHSAPDRGTLELRAVGDGEGETLRKQTALQTNQNTVDSRKMSANSALSYPTPSPTASDHGHSDDRDHSIAMDTVMESEGFTMIDLDSVPSIHRLRNSPLVPTNSSEEQFAADTNPADNEEATTHTPVNESDLSGSSITAGSDLPSSPPRKSSNQKPVAPRSAKPYKVGQLELPSSTRISRNRLVTPMPPQQVQTESPKLPSPPRPRVTREKNYTLSNQAERAAETLQREVTPDVENGGSEQPSSAAPEEALFDGFSASTRRDLRADLRYGEELARREPRRLASGFQPQQDVFLRRQHKEAEWQAERDEIVKAASTKGSDVITVEDDVEEHVGEETTLGDIWLAEARTQTSSPREQQTAPVQDILQAEEKVGPRRQLIPSPWKRGEQIEDTTNVSDSTVSGLFWKEGPSPVEHAGFGAAVLCKPTRQPAQVPAFTRRIRDEYEDAKHDDMTEKDLVENWREASDIIEEETSELEHQLVSPVAQRQAHEAYLTQLYETNLENVPEQDLASPSKQLGTNSVSAHSDDDLTASEGDDGHGIGGIPTPRSALRGGRASMSGYVRPVGTQIGETRNAELRVAWAKRSSCVNEDWEESTRSVRSSQESSSMDDTPSLSTLDGQVVHHDDRKVLSKTNTERKDLGVRERHHEGVTDQPWFRRVKPATADPTLLCTDTADAFEPTSRHVTTVQALPQSTRLTRQQQKRPETSQPVPSYLLPPSYPSLPTRDPAIPLSTSGTFSKTHLQTLHIIHRKSLRPRFHAPTYPQEVRPQILQLVTTKFAVTVDESDTLGEEFRWVFGEREARVLERFMREVEWGYQMRTQAGGVKSKEGIKWGWTVEELAERLGWIVIGEVVRGIEKEKSIVK